IIVLHPTLSGAFQKNGSNVIQICGGPKRSIQVNSSSATGIVISGSSGSVDLSKAGPLATPGNCDGTGADFGDFGGPGTYPGTLTLGTVGKYVQPASPIRDPLITVAAPANPGPGNAGTITAVTSGNYGCPVATCKLYSPGLYASGITVKNENALF